MGSNREELTDLLEDLQLPYPIQCTEADESQVLPGGPVVDLREDPLPYSIQCTDAGESEVSPGELARANRQYPAIINTGLDNGVLHSCIVSLIVFLICLQRLRSNC